MNRITCETARRQNVRAEEQIVRIFGESAVRGCADALFLDAGKSRVLGVCGMEMYMPVCTELLSDRSFQKLLGDTDGSILIDISADGLKVFSAVNDSNVTEPEITAVPADDEVTGAVRSAVHRLSISPGEFNEKGELILDLKAQKEKRVLV